MTEREIRAKLEEIFRKDQQYVTTIKGAPVAGDLQGKENQDAREQLISTFCLPCHKKWALAVINASRPSTIKRVYPAFSKGL